MKCILSATTFVVALFLVHSAFSQEAALDFASEQNPASPADVDTGYEGNGAGYATLCGGCGYAEAYCGCGPTWYAEFEAMSIRFRRADGMSLDVSDPDSAFDYGRQLMPRITAGVVLRSGLGVRLRYFDYDHGDTNANGVMGSVEANVIDLEVFENLRLTPNTALEWSIGIRGNEFTETIDAHPLFADDLFAVGFDGVGLVAGLEVNRMLHWGSIYARGRGALLVGDREIMAPGVGFPELVQQDVTPGMLEFAIGWEFSHVCHNGIVLTSGIGYEVQQWMDFSIAPPTSPSSTTPLDVGFDAAVFSFAVGY